MACSNTFKRVIPSYRLNDIQSVEDVVQFYSQPWQSQVRIRDRPLFFQIDKAALPSNLRIQV